jgi:hypothetical protein
MTAESLPLQEQLAQIRAECKRLEAARALHADPSMHARKIDEEALQLHRELERVNAEIAKLDQRRSPNGRAAPRDSSETLHQVVVLRKRNVALARELENCSDPTACMREENGARASQRTGNAHPPAALHNSTEPGPPIYLQSPGFVAASPPLQRRPRPAPPPTELKQLLAEVQKVQKETEVRTIELRQLDRTADAAGRARIEAEKRVRETQQSDGALDARQMDQLSDSS